MPKKAPISDEHKNDMQTFLQARLAHLLQVGHDLQVDDGVAKYIRIGGSQNDIKFYPHATPIYEVIGVTLDDMILHLGPKWISFFRTKCAVGFRIRDVNKVYLYGCPGRQRISRTK